MITIDVSGSGARMEGTTKAMAEMVGRRGLGWMWSRGLGCWVLPRTFRPETVDLYVDRAVKRLRAEGHEVSVIDDGERDDDETRAARRLERDRELIEVHERRAGRAQAQSDGLLDRARDLASVIPMGQPILAGHYSEGRDRRFRDRIHRMEGKGFEAMGEAEAERGKARSAAARVAAAEKRAAGPRFGPDDVEKGGWVRTRHGWVRVVRISKKSVSIPWWGGDGQTDRTDRVPWAKVLDVAPADADPEPKVFWHREDQQ